MVMLIMLTHSLLKNDLGFTWWVNSGKLIIEDPIYAASKAFTVGEWISGL